MIQKHCVRRKILNDYESDYDTHYFTCNSNEITIEIKRLRILAVEIGHLRTSMSMKSVFFLQHENINIFTPTKTLGIITSWLWMNERINEWNHIFSASPMYSLYYCNWINYKCYEKRHKTAKLI